MADPHPAWRPQPPDTRPVAYGYLRAEDPDEAELAALRTEIARYCKAHELRLVTVFADRGYSGAELARPGFAGLLDALPTATNGCVVTPDLHHLSPNETVREGLLRQVRRTGARVVVTRVVNGSHTDAGSGPPAPGTSCGGTA